MPYRTCVYYPNWHLWEPNKQLPAQIPGINKITNLFYAFLNVNDNGTVVVSNDDINHEFSGEVGQHNDGAKRLNGLLARVFELKSQHRSLKVSMSIGGWSNRDQFSKGLSHKDGISNFVNSSIRLLLEYGFDGIDLDWEYPSNEKEAQQYLDLIKSLRIGLDSVEKNLGLHKGTFLLTIAAPASPYQLDSWPLKLMDQYLSFWNLMTYDFSGAWSSKVQYHCNLYKVQNSDELSADSTVRYFRDVGGIDPKKLIIGMATYARTFGNTRGLGHSFNGVGKSDGVDEEGVWSYKNLPFPGAEEKYDSKAGIAWCFKDGVFASYDNEQSVEQKGKYVVENGLGGGMFWESIGLCRGHKNETNDGLLGAFVEFVGAYNLY